VHFVAKSRRPRWSPLAGNELAFLNLFYKIERYCFGMGVRNDLSTAYRNGAVVKGAL